MSLRPPSRSPGRDSVVRPAAASGRARRFQVTALKPFTYSTTHLIVAVTVAYALTGDWRIALGVGPIEPVVQTFAYMAHEHVWSRATRRADQGG